MQRSIHKYSLIDLIQPNHISMLCKDEVGDDFLLIKHGEVYRCGKEVLRVITFSHKLRAQLRKMGAILKEDRTDDLLFLLDIEVRFLVQIIALDGFKRRPHRDGHFIRKMEGRLGHRIFPFRPSLIGKNCKREEVYGISQADKRTDDWLSRPNKAEQLDIFV